MERAAPNTATVPIGGGFSVDPGGAISVAARMVPLVASGYARRTTITAARVGLPACQEGDA
jgi:hypothetical protein